MKVFIIKKDELNIDEEIKILKKYDITITDKKPDYIITFGGDGTILKAVKFAIKYNVPIIPVNFGRLGYMAEIEKTDFEQSLKNLINKEYNISRRYLLECRIKDKIHYSLNEIAFKYENIGETKLYDNDKKICSFRSDGLIISTATGSTAYAMSAGGSIIQPNLKLLNIVSISSQYLSTRPIILGDILLRIESNANIYIDGKKQESDINVSVYYSNKYIELIESKDKDYYYMLNKKLDWKG